MSRRDSEEKKFDENESDDVLDYLNDNVYGIGDTNIVNNDTKEIEKKTFQSWDDILEIPPLPYNKLIDLEWCNAYLSRGETETPKVETNPNHLDNAYMMNLANFTSNRTVANGMYIILITSKYFHKY